MLLTHTFVAAVSPGWYRYAFYVIYGDRVDFHDEYIREFRQNLEYLGYSLRDKGVVVEPFPPAVDATREQIWFKDWTLEEREEIRKVPSLLVLTKDMGEFSPRSDPWLLFPFTERQYVGHKGRLDLRDAFAAVAEAVVGPDAEPEQLYRLARELTLTKFNHRAIFEAKPGVWGISIDLFEIADALQSQVRNRRRKVGQWPKRSRWSRRTKLAANQSQPRRSYLVGSLRDEEATC